MVKRETIKWKKIFAAHKTYKALTCQHSLRSSYKLMKNNNRKLAKDINRSFTERKHPANKHIKNCSISVIRKMNNETFCVYSIGKY